MDENKHWISRTGYMVGTGVQIVAAQKEINTSNNTFVVATQVFPRMINGSNALRDEQPLFDCFIYYKESPVNQVKIPTFTK